VSLVLEADPKLVDKVISLGKGQILSLNGVEHAITAVTLIAAADGPKAQIYLEVL